MATPTETAAPLRVVLYEGPGATPLEDARRFEILEKLLKAGFQVTVGNGQGEVSAVDDSDVLVLGEKNGADLPFGGEAATADGASRSVRVTFENIDSLDGDAVLQLVQSTRADVAAYEPGQWKPWFPVIDYKRCTNCMQCLSFCLFDVYGVDAEDNIQVKNPDKCKTNCPACSRVCPDVAILFPKYGSGPINGDEVSQEDVDREKMKVDISALLGGDIYSMLRERHEKAQTRFSKERDEGKALKERMRCLKKLQGDVDIPPEVLMSLPSMDQIQSKAKEAKAAAESALEARRRRENASGADGDDAPN